MDKNVPYNVLAEDNYQVFVPIGDDELEKSIEVDENGDYVVQGVMSSDAKDEEDDSINPEGMDCSYFLEKGWIKYEHGNKPNQFIGEPLEVKVGQFTHPTTKKSVNGIFVKGRLFAQRELTKQAIEAMEDLKKSHTKRRMGWSIEGNVKERCKKTGKIIKSVLRNVVLTMNPVNTTTWAELAKSFAKDHELTIDMGEPVDKAMTIEGAQAVMPQSIEGYSPKKDPQQRWVDDFREFVKNLLNKSFRQKFVTSDKDNIESMAYMFALSKGLDYEEADEFASYIAEKHTILKSLGEKIGGAKMGDQVKNTLASLLDEDLDELNKSLELDDEENEDDFEDEEDDELEKSTGGDNEDDEDDDDEGTEDDEDDEDDDEDDEDEETEKSFGNTEFAKSFGANEDNARAFEVSDFLANLVDEIGYSMDGFEKSLGSVRKQSNAIVKAMSSIGNLMKSMNDEIVALREDNGNLQKSLEDVMNRPVGRKGVVNTREVQTIQKSMGSSEDRQLTRAQIGQVLEKSFDAGELDGSVITRFEAGVPLNQLNIPASVRQQIGV